MSKLSIAKRLSKKVRTGVFHFAGRDPVTHERLTRRADLRRIGTRYGGWSIPSELLNAGSICYCVGCGEDITFDLGLIEQFQCEVFAYDPTPRAVEHVKAHAGDVARYHFSAVGLWDKTERLKFYAPSNPTHVSHSLLNLQNTRDYIEVPVERLSAIMARNQHSHLDLLKLDIEGAEYKVIDSIIADDLRIAILCVEFDEYWNPLDKDYLQRIGSYVRKILARGYLMIDAPGNANYTFMKPAAV
jgi:FkbM family methyltransferase